MRELVIPREFTENVTRLNGDEGAKWLKSLPKLIENTVKELHLELDTTPPKFGAAGIVYFVRSGGDKLALKLSFLDEYNKYEATALRFWEGNGSPKLVYDNPTNSVILMERLSDKSLEDISIFSAGRIAGRLIRQLSVPCGLDIIRLEDRVASIRSDIATHSKPLSKNVFIDLKLIDQLISDRQEFIDEKLVHGDIHYSNIHKAYDGGWKATDPKPVIGDPEFAVPELLWTRVDELEDNEIVKLLDTIVKAGNFNRQKALEWSLIRVVDYYYWAKSHNLTIDPPRCRRVYKQLVQEL